MRHDADFPNLRDAFSPEPESCHSALMDAARSVREEKQVKRISLRAVLIAAIVLIVMTAAALAAGNAGLLDWFHQSYGANLPKTAQDVLSATEQHTLDAGPVTVTVRETLADGQIAYLTAEAKLKAGEAGILYAGSGDPNDLVGESLAGLLDVDGVTAETTLIEAAKASKQPLYAVTVWLAPDRDITAGEEMMDSARQTDGSLMLVDMIYTDPAKVGAELTGEARVIVQELDPETGDWKEGFRWEVGCDEAVAVNGVTAEKTYAPSGTDKLMGFLTVEQVTAEQTCAGVYVKVLLRADEGTTLDRLQEQAPLDVLDASGQSFPTGLSLTAEYLQADGTPFDMEQDPAEVMVPEVLYKMMITVDSLPDEMIVTDGVQQVSVK